MSTMSRIFTAIILFIEIQSISSLTGYEIRALEESNQGSNNGPTLIFHGGFPGGSPPYNPNMPQQQGGTGPYQRPPYRPNHGNLVFHNPNNNPPVGSAPADVQKPDIPSVEGPPVFTFNPNAPPQGSPQMRPNPADPQLPPPPPPVQPVQPKGPVAKTPSDQTQQDKQPQDNNGPIINAGDNAEQNSATGQQVFIQHGRFDKDTLLYSTQAQAIIGTLAAFLGLCALVRCYSKCCWDSPRKRSTMAHDEYNRGAAVTRQTTRIEADIDWSDHTENEDDPLDDDDYDDNVLTDVQQMRSRKARELVPDESIDSGIYSNADDRLDINQADVEILMEEEDDQNNGDNQPLTDDETKAIMREFKDTDDEYVD